MGNPDIKEAMDMMYCPISDTCNGEVDLTGLLLLVLTSIIYHLAWLKTIVAQNPGHTLSLIPFLNIPELLKKLQLKVDLKEVGQLGSY